MAAFAPCTEIPGTFDRIKYLFPGCGPTKRQHPFGYRMTDEYTHTLSRLLSREVQYRVQGESEPTFCLIYKLFIDNH